MIASSYDSSGDSGSGAKISFGLEMDDQVPSKILIVDDEPDILEEVSECLGDEGFKWVTAQSAEEAGSLVDLDSDIGIVVTDIRMPGTDGLEFSRRLFEKYGDERTFSSLSSPGTLVCRKPLRPCS